MNLRKEILTEHSKEQCRNIVNWIGSSQQRFDELFRLFMEDESPVVQRAAWPLSYAAIAHPEFMKNNFQRLIKKLKQPDNHNAVKRNAVRLLQEIEIPKKWQGCIMDTCFQYLASHTEPVAVKVFSMTVLANLSKTYPEIAPELRLLIEAQLPTQTAGFKSRAKKVLNQLTPNKKG